LQYAGWPVCAGGGQEKLSKQKSWDAVAAFFDPE